MFVLKQELDFSLMIKEQLKKAQWLMEQLTLAKPLHRDLNL